MASQSPIKLGEEDSVGFLRVFQVETFRGGMNRLLLRARSTDGHLERVEILFQYVQRLDIPMSFEGLTVEDSTGVDGLLAPWSDVLANFPECRVFRLYSGGRIVGRIVASECAYGEDEETAEAPSMFFMMG